MLFRHKWLLIACIVLMPAVVFGVSQALGKTYESSVIVQVRESSADLSVSASRTPTASSGVLTAARLIETTAVTGDTLRRLNTPGLTRQDLLEAIDVAPEEDTGFITISARSTNAERARQIADAMAASLIAVRRDLALRSVDGTLRRLEDQLEDLPSGASAGRTELVDQIQQLRTLSAAQLDTAEVVEPAARGSVVAPQPLRNALFAAVVGLLAAVGLVVLLESLDRRLRDPQDIERLFDSPLLALVPEDAFPGRGIGNASREAFQVLRTNLHYFNVDDPVRSVLVTSAGQGEGKTTVAVNLAIAAATAGVDVLLIDADLRRPQVSARMGLEAGPDHGLAEVLAGDLPLMEAIEERSVDGGAGRLRVLNSGTHRSNPTALLSSNRMRELLTEAHTVADLVIVDTTPLLPVADPMPLLDQVSGIVVVARLGATSRDALVRLRQVVVTAGGTLVGTVATGVRNQEFGYGYGYGYGSDGANGYSEPHSGRSRRRFLRRPRVTG